MPFSSGTYTLPAGNPVVTATTIQTSWANTTLADISTALSTCVLKDGTQTLTANIPMGGFKLTGLGAGSSANDSARLSQVQGGASSYLTGTAGTNTITASGSPTVTVLTTGQRFTFIPANTNTGASTLQIDSTAATNIFWNNVALVGSELRQNVPVEVMYDGTQYQLIASGAMANTFAIPDSFKLQAAGDRTKMFTISVTGVPTLTTVTMLAPGTGGATIVGDTLAQTLTNKSFTAPTFDSPTINTLVTGSAVALKAVMVSGTSNSAIVSPGQFKFHSGSAKAWGYISPPTTVNRSFPSGASVVKNAVGDYSITHNAGFQDALYTAFFTLIDSATPMTQAIIAQTTSTTRIIIVAAANTGGNTIGLPVDPNSAIYYVCYGLPA